MVVTEIGASFQNAPTPVETVSKNVKESATIPSLRMEELIAPALVKQLKQNPAKWKNAQVGVIFHKVIFVGLDYEIRIHFYLNPLNLEIY